GAGAHELAGSDCTLLTDDAQAISLNSVRRIEVHYHVRRWRQRQRQAASQPRWFTPPKPPLQIVWSVHKSLALLLDRFIIKGGGAACVGRRSRKSGVNVRAAVGSLPALCRPSDAVCCTQHWQRS